MSVVQSPSANQSSATQPMSFGPEHHVMSAHVGPMSFISLVHALSSWAGFPDIKTCWCDPICSCKLPSMSFACGSLNTMFLRLLWDRFVWPSATQPFLQVRLNDVCNHLLHLCNDVCLASAEKTEHKKRCFPSLEDGEHKRRAVKPTAYGKKFGLQGRWMVWIAAWMAVWVLVTVTTPERCWKILKAFEESSLIQAEKPGLTLCWHEAWFGSIRSRVQSCEIFELLESSQVTAIAGTKMQRYAFLDRQNSGEHRGILQRCDSVSHLTAKSTRPRYTLQLQSIKVFH